MRLQELFLVETTEEDRAIISLSSAIYNHARKYIDYIDPNNDEPVEIGTIGDIVDTPLEYANNIKIELQSSEGIKDRLEKGGSTVDRDKTTLGVWDNGTIVLNADHLSNERIKSTIGHELRHALDDFKSGGITGYENRYNVPKKKEHRKKDEYGPNYPYLAKPSEINARFNQVLTALTDVIADQSDLPSDQLFDYAIKRLKLSFRHHKIAMLFPEKEQSKDYKQLVKRAVDFIQKEIKHVKSESF